MCGILFIADAAGSASEASGGASVSSDAHHHVAPFLQGLATRGPDKTGIETIYVRDTILLNIFAARSNNSLDIYHIFFQIMFQIGGDGTGNNPTSPLRLTFAGSILQLRGHNPVSPPLVDPNSGNILLWNGEIFNENLENKGNILNIPSGGNDAKGLLHALTTTTDIPAVFSSIRGPWACVFWHAETDTLWFGRDVLGRRSLLIKWPVPEKDKNIDNDNGLEIKDGLTGGIASGDSFILTSVVPLDHEKSAEGYLEVEPGLYKLKLIENFSRCACVEKTTTMNKGVEASAEDNLHNKLAILKLNKGFVTALDWQDEEIKQIKAFHRPENLINVGDDDDNHDDMNATKIAVEGVLRALRDAVRVRCHCIDNPITLLTAVSSSSQQNKDLEEEMIKPAKLMILFSGGVDSTLLAALAHEYLPPEEPIDLVSICFAQGTSPDREAALSAFEELNLIAPTRPWRLLGADKVLEDVENAQGRLLRLLYPSDTVMDLNIGAALWLAAAGQGKILKVGGSRVDNVNDNGGDVLGLKVGMVYRSAARCVFLGHGADELFGGYGRHRTRFRNAGWQGLSEELEIDVKRLWVRNLGRDDRLVADCSREARHPFLDERVVLQALCFHKISSLTDLRMELGVGDKLVLREILRKLGLPIAAGRVKRAIQFGTRLAKATNAAQFGGTRQANAKQAGRVRLGGKIWLEGKS
jgi:asparagine synthetase B (glutamine-hydrolysing)